MSKLLKTVYTGWKSVASRTNLNIRAYFQIYEDVDSENNKSKITYKHYIQYTYEDHMNEGNDYSVDLITRVQYLASFYSKTKSITIKNYTSNTIYMGSTVISNVKHNDDGKYTLGFQGSFNENSNGYVYTAHTTIPLTTIQTAFACSISNFDLGQNPTITIGVNNTSYTYNLSYYINENINGTIGTGLTNATYLWEMGTDLINQIKNAFPFTKNIPITINCETFNGSTSKGTKKASATITIIDIPTISSVTKIETVGTIKQFTSSNSVLKDISKIKFTFTGAAPTGTTLKTYNVKIGERVVTSETNEVLVENIIENENNNSDFYCYVTDYRDNSSDETLITIPFVNYVKSDYINTECFIIRNNANIDKADVTLKGNFFNGNIGIVANILKLGYKYREKGSTEAYTTGTTALSLDEKITLDETLDHTKNYEFVFTISDLVYLGTEMIKVLPTSEYVMCEYESGVDFKNAYIKGEQVATLNDIPTSSDGTTDYEKLDNLPTINGTELKGDLTSEDLGVPTNTSDLTNDSGFITNSVSDLTNYYKKTETDTLVNTKVDKVSGKGLSTNDFTNTYKSNVDSNTSARHTHSNKTVLDSITSTKVSSWDNKVDKVEGKGLSTNDFTDEHEFRLQVVENNSHTHDNATVLAGITSDKVSSWDNKSDFSGSYNDLTNKPTIPTKTSQLTNDSGFKTTDNNTTYSLSKSGSTITLTGSDGSTTSVTDANTTVTVDSALSSTSTNPVQNKVVNSALNGKQDTISDLSTIRANSSLVSSKQDQLTTTQLNAVNSGITSTKVSTYDGYATTIGKKVDKVSGKGLSTNDLTDALVTKINNASTFSGSYNDLTNKPTIPTVPTKVSAFTNDAGYITSVPSEYITETELNSAISGKANTSDLDNYYTKTETNNTFATTNALMGVSNNMSNNLQTKQDKLVSGTNIKTINGNSLLGEGNITIESGSGGSTNVYSEEEQAVGTWIDGSTVYRKVIHYGTLPNANSKTVAHNISNLYRVIKTDIMAYESSSGRSMGVPHVGNLYMSSSVEFAYRIDGTYIYIYSSTDETDYDAYAILEYIKTS